MATARWRPRTPLTERLFAEPHAFDFFQAVQVLEREVLRRRGTAGAGRIGEDEEPRHEAVRIAAHQSMAFPSAAITEAKTQAPAETGAAERPARMAVAFMGLTGPSGVLPQHYTETLIRSLRVKSTSLRDFLDIFNHRLASLFHRSWQKYRLPATFERNAPQEDPITSCLMALVGLDTPHLRRRLSVDDEAIVHYAGHFAHWPRSASALEAILSDFLQRPARIEQFSGRWIWLAPEDFTALGSRAQPEGSYARLGVDAVAGERVWDVQGSFRIRIGPLSYRQFISFLPGTRDLQQVADLTRLFVGPTFSFDAQLTLSKAEVPFLKLGESGEQAPRLGWNTWLKHEEFRQDASDAIFLLDHA